MIKENRPNTLPHSNKESIAMNTFHTTTPDDTYEINHSGNNEEACFLDDYDPSIEIWIETYLEERDDPYLNDGDDFRKV